MCVLCVYCVCCVCVICVWCVSTHIAMWVYSASTTVVCVVCVVYVGCVMWSNVCVRCVCVCVVCVLCGICVCCLIPQWLSQPSTGLRRQTPPFFFSLGLYATRESAPVEIDNDMGIEDAAKPLDPLRDRNSCLLENQ